MVVVADAGMLSASNLRELDEAQLGFIVGSRSTKAPIDLASHFRWHGDAFADGQLIDTITPKERRGHNKGIEIELVLKRGGWVALVDDSALAAHGGVALTLRSRD